VGRAALPSDLPEAASARLRRSLSEVNRSGLAWAAARSHRAWEAERPVAPWEAEVRSRCASAAWVACQPPCPPKAGYLQGGDPRWPAGRGPLPCIQQAPVPPDRCFRRSPHGRHWAYPPDVLGVDSCLAPSPPRTLSDTPTRPTAVQAEKLCPPLHRLAGDRRSHRLLSMGTSFPVGTAHPRRCPECSSQAAAGSPPSRKSRNMCGAAFLSFRPVVCWPPPAGVLCLLSGDVLAHQCSD
jgi:hypothetical protein